MQTELGDIGNLPHPSAPHWSMLEATETAALRIWLVKPNISRVGNRIESHDRLNGKSFAICHTSKSR